VGWLVLANKQWAGWGSYPVAEDCWQQFAKWPDGQPWTVWDRAGFFNDNMTRPGAEASLEVKEKREWMESAWQKIDSCSSSEESAKPVLQHAAYVIGQNWIFLKEYILLMVIPPALFLTAGWIASGRRREIGSTN
jgi:hypothetical protein